MHRLPNTFDLYLNIVVGAFYILSLLCDMTALFKCALTDPGILPAIPSENIDKTK
jgi:hypothetical protein